MKRCPGCGIEKSVHGFAKNKRKKDGLQIYCRACKKKIDAKHYSRNREKQLARNKGLHLKYSNEINRIKSLKGCCVCFEKDACCLDFHHVNGKKLGAISTLTRNCSKKIFEEIDKCEVLCANCHRKLHKGRFELVPR